MKYLTLILLLSPYFTFSQTEKIASSDELKSFSIGFQANHILGRTTDLQYVIYDQYFDSENIDKSFSQQYALNLGYTRKNAFVRLSVGTFVDYVDINISSSSNWGDYDPSGIYYQTSSSRSQTVINDRNRSFFMGAEIGGFSESYKWFKLGGTIGVNYSGYFHSKVMSNEVSGSYSSSYNNPSGSGTSSGTFTYGNESEYWSGKVRKSNSAILAPEIKVIFSFQLSDQFFLEVHAAQRFAFQMKDGRLSQMDMQIPIGLGFQYHIF